MTSSDFSLLTRIGKSLPRFAGRIACGVLCIGLFGSLPASGDANQNSPGQAVAIKTCSVQLTAGDKRYLGKVIQTQLASIYQNNPEFQAQLKTEGKLLNDGIVGPRTRYWLDYFCGEFAFTAPASPASHQIFIESLVNDLSRATQLNALFPAWRTVIQPSELLHLTSAEILKRLTLKQPSPASPTSSGKALPQSDTAPYYYQLTEKDLASLTLRQTVLDTFTKLEKQQFDQRSQLYNQLSDLFSQLNIPAAPPLNIDSLIDSYTIETVHPSSSATTSTSTSQTTSSVAGGGPAEGENADEQSDLPGLSTQVTETSTQSDTQTTAPQVVWQLDPEALKKTLSERGIAALDKEELSTLAPLQDEVFASLYLMQMAVNESGISPENLIDKGVFALARKQGLPPAHAVPMHWEAPPDCGCQDSARSIFNVGTFYGFYPYWQHLKKGETIDFTHLDRIGYIGAVMKPEGNGNTLELPQNWKAAPAFSQFIQTTHRYRTKLDLVVTTPRDLSREQLTALFTDDMVKRLVDAVTAPMDKYIINNAQPWISFGLHGVPTMAEGITLDIDLSILDTEESQQAFFSFLDKLKIALRQRAEPTSDSSELSERVSNNDAYYLNVIVPIKDVVANKDNFYSFTNLDILSQRTNLLIVRPGSPELSGKANDELNQIKALQQWLSNQPNQEAVQQVYRRLTPMLITEDNRNQPQALTQLVNLSSWSFLGAAYWPLPLSESNEKLIDKTFFPQAPQYPRLINQVINGVNSLLNEICIYRWEIRTGLFVTFLVIFAFLIACIWSFPLRKHLSRLPFVALTSLSISGLMLVFMADPIFQDYQGPILLIFVVVIGWILFAVRMVRKEGDRP
ncbi:TPA: hypothetical protein QCG56_003024 [Enterobacter cancerogenus]|nr:hypothetical protein [Enterobacter cancerogenus]HDR2166153.1 hypothetical protein [Enterobacter cancerogenus]HDR2268734.1 hypothetical protein [Enterobacter cancerogenus]